MAHRTRDRTPAERAHAEAALDEMEERYRTLVETMDEGFTLAEVVRDASGAIVDTRVLDINAKAEAIAGLRRADVIGRLQSEVMRGDLRTLATYARVVETGERAHFEHYAETRGLWYDVRVFARGRDRFAVLWSDVTERKRAEIVLRESAARQTFLLALEDRLRGLVDPRDVLRAAAEMLGRHLGLATVQYSMIEPDGDTVDSAVVYSDGRIDAVKEGQRYRLSDLGGWGSALRAGVEVFSDDNESDPRALSAAETRSRGLRAGSAVPFMVNGRLVAVLASAHPEPRRWTEEEKRLTREVAARTWAALERARAEAARNVSDGQMRLAMRVATMFVWTIDVVTGRASYSGNYGDVVGFPPDPRPIRALDALRDRAFPEDMPRIAEALERTMRGDGDMHLEYRLRNPETGNVVWLETHATLVVDAATASKNVVGIAQNVTARKRSEQTLRDAEAALRALNESLEQRVRDRTDALTHQIEQRMRAEEAQREVLRRLVTAEEDERRRISRELHDSLGQLVAALLLGLKALETRPDGPHIADLASLANRIAREMQSVAVELRPPGLDDLGLVPALRSYLDEWSRRSGVDADFHASGATETRLSPEVETTAYRLVQEALTNVLKHASATRVSVVLELRAGSLRAIVEDDGRGFDPDAVASSPEKARCLGLRGMKERVALLHGALHIESSPGAGTTIFLTLPDTPPPPRPSP